MKFCEGKIVELDPNKTYWLFIKRGSMISPDAIEHMSRDKDMIFFVNDFDEIEFVENPEQIKGIVVKEF